MAGAVLSAFGNRLVDAAVATGLASVLAGGLYVGRHSYAEREHFALAIGIVYALVCVTVYVAPRYVLDSFAAGVFSAQYLGWLLIFVVPLLVAQGAVPTYLFVSRGFVGALAGLFAATAVTFWILLALGGESDVLVLYPTVVTPIAITAVGLGIVGEIGLRAASDARGG